MHAVIRTYAGNGAKELFDLLEKRKSDVEELMRSIQGFVAYDLVRTDSGGTSFTVCQNKAGVNESIRRAKEWIATNASDIRANDPVMSEGPVLVHLGPPETSADMSPAIPLSTVS
jgi:hypothetical protein